jgi:phasin family protein
MRADAGTCGENRPLDRFVLRNKNQLTRFNFYLKYALLRRTKELYCVSLIPRPPAFLLGANMFTIPEQLSTASKSSLEANLAVLTSLSTKAFEGVEKIIGLNLITAKVSLDDSTAAAKQLLAAKDPQEFFSLAAAQAQPNMEKVIAYGRHLASIASDVNA